MAFLPGSTTVTIRGRWQAPDGSPARGDVELTLDAPYADATANVTYTQEKRKYTLDANGEISVPYIITGTFNQVSGQLSGTKVKIRENFEDTKSYTWQTAFTSANITDTDKIWLSDLSAVEARPLNQYVSLGSYGADQAVLKSTKADRIQTGDSTLVGATVNALVRRASDGRIQTLEPTSAAHTTSKNYVDNADALKANLASPALTGTPTAPTATAGTNTTQLATTGFVTTADNLKAPLASPTFTGTPTAPTAAVTTNTTQLATTAFTQSAINAGTSNLEVPLRSGDYYSASFPGTSSGTFLNGTFTGSIFIPSRSTSLIRIGVRVTTAGTTGALIRLGVYTFNLATNGATLVQDAGTVDGTTTGYKELTIAASVDVGQAYFIGAVFQGAPTTAPVINIGTGSHPQLSGNASGDSMATNSIPGLQVSGITGALPATINSGGLIAAGTCAKVVVRA